ncbi:deoxyribose-phosphate aldolase [Galbibacter sp. BG1]|uniref:DUF6503 family protein n=1 Tax=Galbibacter sp. BG1 TaxID=1170699 RepID=UPI0015BFCA1B|nr:DUF6503 family protein [Galbibacter sp. BG1]QLE03023.1 deoxyribose-phosphate aldolase [Galbibacter sp. BG1]
MKLKLTLSLLILAFLSGCTPNMGDDVNTIINKSIEVSGMNNLDGKEISFVFRGKEYQSTRQQGRFELKRIIKDSVVIEDILNNDSFKRLVDGKPVQMADTTSNKLKNSVNSVHYFAYLPFGLDGASVNKELLGKTDIKGKSYFKIKVWFDQEGGGEDFEDVFLYWINLETYKVDYLAYEYHVNEGGMRFREAYNRRTIEGIDFVDYKNYKPANKDADLLELDKLFNEDKLELLSKIDLENVQVQ